MSLAIISPWPADFLARIETLNQEKGKDAPIALVLTAAVNQRNQLVCPSQQHLFLTLAKTHRVIMRTIQQKSDISQEISRVRPERIRLLAINAHGNEDGFSLNDSDDFYGTVDPHDFEYLPDDADIFLLSCYPGLDFARRMASVIPHTIFAPHGKLFHLKTCLVNCPIHQKIELRSFSGQDQHVRMFKQHMVPEHCLTSDEEVRSYFYDMQKFLFDRAEAGDAAASYEIGSFFEADEDLSQAETWYRYAASLGNCAALEQVGELFRKKHLELQETDPTSIDQIQEARNQAKLCFTKAAEQDDSRAHYYLGLIEKEENHLDLAEEHFQHAAKHKIHEAYFSLGDIYQQKFTIGQAKQDASIGLETLRKQSHLYYHRAYELGNKYASYAIGCLYEEEKNIPKAIKWFQIAKEEGRSRATDKLHSLGG